MQDHETRNAWAKIAFVWLAGIGSLTAQQWAVIAGLVSTILVAVYTAMQIYVLWRDKIVKYRPVHNTRVGDSTNTPTL